MMLNSTVDSDDDIPWSERLKKESKLDEKLPKRNKKNGDETQSLPKKRIKEEEEQEIWKCDDDIPWSERLEKESRSDEKFTKRNKKNGDGTQSLPKKRIKGEEEEEMCKCDDDIPWSERLKKESKSDEKPSKRNKKNGDETQSPPKKRKKGEEEEEIWKWWEEEKREDGVKWKTLEHKGPVFAPPYIPLPDNVKFKYDGQEMKLSEATEEVAGFYAKMLDHDYTQKPNFNKNFMHDWRKIMSSGERAIIKDLSKCDFKDMFEFFKSESEKRKARSKEEKKADLELRKKEADEYGVAFIDSYKQKIANFRIEPPGLFRGRGDHPKMGSLKRRVMPEDVTINCSKGAKVPPPPSGHKWQGIVHDNSVTWLATWVENVLNLNKYIMLNPSSKLKGEKDWEKFETARRLKSVVGEIRETYQADFKSKEMRIRQRAVALYFIDKLALRAGNEKDTEEAADTVGCCSLRCEHIQLHDELDGNKYVVEFDFLGKDSIRYYNRVPVEKSVYKNLKKFMEQKNKGDDLFDRLDTSSLNEHLRSLMPGLTVKVFRTYNASITLQDQLDKITNVDDSIPEKLLAYNRANRQVAILCNHQRAVPKTFEKSMENLQNKIEEKKKEFKDAKAELKEYKGKDKDKLERKVARLKEQLKKLKVQRVDKDENKQIALGTSKLNYMDPRITVAWCKRNDVAIEKIFSKTQREKFRWAIDMADEDYIF